MLASMNDLDLCSVQNAAQAEYDRRYPDGQDEEPSVVGQDEDDGWLQLNEEERRIASTNRLEALVMYRKRTRQGLKEADDALDNAGFGSCRRSRQ